MIQRYSFNFPSSETSVFKNCDAHFISSEECLLQKIWNLSCVGGLINESRAKIKQKHYEIRGDFCEDFPDRIRMQLDSNLGPLYYCFLLVDQIYHLASPASPPNYMYNPIKVSFIITALYLLVIFV